MIYLGFTLSNPFSNRYSCVYEKTGNIWNPYKFWTLTICKSSAIVGFTFDISPRQDHAGFGIGFEFLGWDVEFRVNDSRHWNYSKGCWEVYEV